jgi:hypothetical protein
MKGAEHVFTTGKMELECYDAALEGIEWGPFGLTRQGRGDTSILTAGFCVGGSYLEDQRVQQRFREMGPSESSGKRLAPHVGFEPRINRLLERIRTRSILS